MPTITIEGKMIGRRQPLFGDWSIPIPPEETSGGRLTLRDLITRVVLDEVRAYCERQEERRFVRTLTSREIDAGVARGKVDSGGREPGPLPDPEVAVGTALLAFEDGLYYVFVDDEQQTDLDREVYLQPETRVTFLRLVALAGG